MDAANATYQKSVQQLKESQVTFDANQVTTLQVPLSQPLFRAIALH
jgi:hypothetical protein